MNPSFDPTMIILLPAMLFAFWAQYKVKNTFATYSKVRASRSISADEAAQRLLSIAGLGNMRIEHIAGELTDHYDPSAKVLRLSSSVSGNASIAAIGVAAHEVGHAIQDKEGYALLRFRNSIVPLVNICSTVSMPLFIIGLSIGAMNLATLGIVLFIGVLVFHLVTLPVELDASSRALKMLSQTGILTSGELSGAKSVLSAAAMTYLAALVTAIANLIYFIALRNSRNSRRD